MSRISLLVSLVCVVLAANSRGDDKINRTLVLEKAVRVAEEMKDSIARVNALAQLATVCRDTDPKRAQALLQTIDSLVKATNAPNVTDALLLASIDGRSKVERADEIEVLLREFSNDMARDKALSVFAGNLARHGEYKVAFENARKIKSHDTLFSTMSEIALQSALGGDGGVAAAASREMNPQSKNDFSRKLITVSQLAKSYQKTGKPERARDSIKQVLALAEIIDIAAQATITVKLVDGGLNEERFHGRLSEVVEVLERQKQPPTYIYIDCLIVTVRELLAFDRVEESVQMLERAEQPPLRDYLAGLIAERQAQTGDATAARNTLQSITGDSNKAPALLVLAKAAILETRQHEARQLLAEVRDAIDNKQSHANVSDLHQLAVKAATLQVGSGDIAQAISWVEEMKQPELKFDCLLAILNELSERPKDQSR